MVEIRSRRGSRGRVSCVVWACGRVGVCVFLDLTRVHVVECRVSSVE
jgi:predicted ThiF/HesA family dinucleotide-utilizing enzyme